MNEDIEKALEWADKDGDSKNKAVLAAAYREAVKERDEEIQHRDKWKLKADRYNAELFQRLLKIEAVEKSRDQAQAECAAMREAIINDPGHDHMSRKEDCFKRICKSLSSDAGREFLERLERAGAENEALKALLKKASAGWETFTWSARAEAAEARVIELEDSFEKQQKGAIDYAMKWSKAEARVKSLTAEVARKDEALKMVRTYKLYLPTQVREIVEAALKPQEAGE